MSKRRKYVATEKELCSQCAHGQDARKTFIAVSTRDGFHQRGES